jgi:hypothetical protein
VVNRFAIADGTTVTANPADGGPPIRRWLAPIAPYLGWFGGDDVVFEHKAHDRLQLARSHGDSLASLFTYELDAQLQDVDFRGDRAVVTWHGVAHQVSLDDGTRLGAVSIPGCPDGFVPAKTAVLEPGGPRVATSDAHIVAIWNGAAAVATTRFDDDVVEHAAFVAGGDVAVLLHHHLALWTPATGEIRTIGVSSIFEIAASPNGRWLALAFGDDRVAVLDLGAFRAAVTAYPAVVEPVPAACPHPDPFAS